MFTKNYFSAQLLHAYEEKIEIRTTEMYNKLTQISKNNLLNRIN